MGYIRKEVEELIGMSARKIQFYTDLGLVIPAVENPTGRGTTRRYSRRNMFELLIIQELVRNGVTLENVKTLMLAMTFMFRMKGIPDWHKCPHWDVELDEPKKGAIVIYDPPEGKGICSIHTNEVGDAVERESPKVTLTLEFNSALILNLEPLIAKLPKA